MHNLHDNSDDLKIRFSRHQFQIVHSIFEFVLFEIVQYQGLDLGLLHRSDN